MSRENKKYIRTNLPIDMNNMPSMSDLLGDKKKSAAGNSKVNDGLPSESKRQSRTQPELLPIETDNMPSMEELLNQKKEVVSQETSAAGTEEKNLDAEILGKDKGFLNDPLYTPDKVHKYKSRKTLGKIIRKRSWYGKHFVIDGSNVCRSYIELESSSSLTPLLTLVHALLNANANFKCIFDANERYVLQRNLQETSGERIYEMLLREFSSYFEEAPGGTDADARILETANRSDSLIISNDRFDKCDEQYHQHYTWLGQGSKRLVKGKVEENYLILPSLGLNIPLRLDLENAVAELSSRLTK